jgi:hypothetical protein
VAARKARRPAADRTARKPRAVLTAGELKGREANPQQPEPQALAFHSLADIFPLLEGAEFDGVVADVRAHVGARRVSLWATTRSDSSCR